MLRNLRANVQTLGRVCLDYDVVRIRYDFFVMINSLSINTLSPFSAIWISALALDLHC